MKASVCLCKHHGRAIMYFIMVVVNNIQSIRQRTSPIFHRYGVRRAAIFGSFARGEEQKTSDVDLLVEVPKEMDLFSFVALKQDLEERLGRDVDLVTYRSIDYLLRDRILAEQVPIYEKRS